MSVARCTRASLEGAYEGDVEGVVRAVGKSVEEWADNVADQLEREECLGERSGDVVRFHFFVAF